MSWARLLALFLLCLLPIYGNALEIDTYFGMRNDYSTNSGRSATNEVEEWIYQPRARITSVHEGSRVKLDGSYDFTKRYYQQDVFSDENVVVGKLDFYANVLEGRLDFSANNRRSETPIRSFEEFGVRNRQENAISSLGPTLRFNTGGLNEFQLEYQYSTRDSDRTSTDSTGHTLVARQLIVPSITDSFAFEAIRQEIQFENPAAPDLKTNTLQASWQREGDLLSWNATAGYQSTERTLGADDENGFIGTFDLTADLSGTTKVTFNLAREIRDQSAFLESGEVSLTEPLNVDSDSNELFLNERAGFTLKNKSGRTDYSIGVLFDREDYYDVPRDKENLRVFVAIERKLTKLTRASLRMEHHDEDFLDQDLDVSAFTGNIQLTRRLNPKLTLTSSIYYRERRPTGSNNSQGDTDEWIGSIEFNYKLF